MFKNIFNQPYPGEQCVLEELLEPLIGEYTAHNEDILKSNPAMQKLAEQANILQIKRIADFELDDIPLNVFDITLSDNVRLKYSRVNIQKVVRSIMDYYSGAIMFFHTESNQGDWRISFVEKEDTQKSGTSAKRYTFLVGESQSVKTVTQRFEILKNTPEKSVKAIREAFSVEALSKEFFEKYKLHYEDFVQYISGKRFVKEKGKWVEKSIGKPSEEYVSVFEKNDKSVRDFVKKMLGRIVFLHFLQKKKWLCNDENYLQNLFEKSDKNNYLENVLEPLFFGVLNTKSADRKVLFENENWDLSLLKEWENIPYLNGGLFEKDELDKKKVIFPESLFSDLFDFFSQYNFTIDENDPNDSEVGIDPEMLGKIFENLLEDNKDKGAFYTPKEIVQYMCRESLIAYLFEKHKDDEKNIRDLVEHHIADWNEDTRKKILNSLKEVKICDPAIGSGAFPMGLLNELYKCRLALGEEKSVNIKKEIIQNNIYGVDIEKGAVDIARLRFWLALVVEEENAEPLPNLDYKIMQGNSLLESYQGIDLSNLTKTKTEREKPNISVTLFDEQLDVHRFQLSEYIKEYFACINSERKEEIRRKIDESIRTQLKEDFISVDFSNINLSANSHFFLWHLYFADIFADGGFDIVIGNPPYIKEYENKSAFDGFRKSKYYIGKMDIWYGFTSIGLNILKENGILSFIAQNNWVTSAGAKLLREDILERAKIEQFIDFGNYKVFDSAGIQTMIFLLKKTKDNKQYSLKYSLLQEDKITPIELKEFLEFGKENRFGNKKFLYAFKSEKFVGTTFNFANSEIDDILEKIEKKGAFKLCNDEVAQGIVPNPDIINSRNISLLPNTKILKYNIKIGDGVFVVEKGYFKNIPSIEKNYIKPLYEPYLLQNYKSIHYEKEIIYITKNNYNDDAPNLISHLEKFREIMDNRRENINKRLKYYHLHWARNNYFFEKGDKILCVRKCQMPTFIFTEKEAYTMMSVNIIKTTRINQKYLTLLLNSKLIEFWLRHKGKMQGNNFQIDKEPILSIPIIQTKNEDFFVELFDEIVNLTEKNQDTKTLEKRINILIYKLYDLTFEDIKIIDPTIAISDFQ